MARIKYYNTTTGAWEYADEVMTAPVQSVNGKTGAVILSAADVGAEQAGAVAELEGRVLLKQNVSTKKAQLTLEDGSTVLIDVVVASEGSIVETYTNQMPISIGTDGAVYNGTGWKGGYRLSGSSGEEREYSNAAVTGFMPVKAGDIVRMKYTGDARVWDVNATNAANVVVYYDSTFAWLGSIALQPSAYGICTTADVPTGSLNSGEVVNFTVPDNSGIAYVRVSMVADIEDIADLIVTVNEEIV